MNITNIFKLGLLLYIILTPYLDNSVIKSVLDNKINKIIVVLIILIISNYDKGVGLLLTLCIIFSINYRLPNFRQYKRIFTVDNFENNNEYDEIDNSLFNLFLDNDNYYKYEKNF